MALRLWALLAALGLSACTTALPPIPYHACALSGAIQPDSQAGLREPPRETIVTLRCRLPAG